MGRGAVAFHTTDQAMPATPTAASIFNTSSAPIARYEKENAASFHHPPDETPPAPVPYPRGTEPEGSDGASTSELRRVIWEMLMKSIFPLSCWT